jgi:hypothetical protein
MLVMPCTDIDLHHASDGGAPDVVSDRVATVRQADIAKDGSMSLTSA